MAFRIKEINKTIIAALKMNLGNMKALGDNLVNNDLSTVEIDQSMKKAEANIKAANAGIKTPTM